MSFPMPADARLSGLALRVSDIEAQLAFYRDLFGLPVKDEEANVISLGPAGGDVTLELVHEPGAPLRPQPTVGLYHFALLLPGRAALAAILLRLLEARYPLQGASDHGVSEALYLADPEGNGIELYRDRPREDWPRAWQEGSAEAGVAMGSEPLDVDDLLRQAGQAGSLDAATRLGHMHLKVDDLRTAEAFYAGELGLDVTQRSYPGALFLSVGGYHHHIGLNTWGRPRRAPETATGLLAYTWAVPPGTLDGERHLRDPADVEVVVRSRS